MIEIKRKCFGIRIEEREHDGKMINPICTMITEDDDIWHEEQMKFDAGWIDDIIFVLEQAKKSMPDIFLKGS